MIHRIVAGVSSEKLSPPPCGEKRDDQQQYRLGYAASSASFDSMPPAHSKHLGAAPKVACVRSMTECIEFVSNLPVIETLIAQIPQQRQERGMVISRHSRAYFPATNSAGKLLSSRTRPIRAASLSCVDVCFCVDHRSTQKGPGPIR